MTTHITKTWFDGEKVVTQEIPESEAEKQEPVGEVLNERGEVDYISYIPPVGTPLYTAPRQWVELTDDEARALVNRATFGDKTNWQALVYMIDAKLKEKNAA
jgi:hypothetical protein